MQDVFQHNFYPSLLITSGILLAFHYSQMVASGFGCPIVVAEGKPETGKSKSLLTGLSIIG